MNRWIERQRHILDFTISSLLRRKGRNVILVLAYTLVIFFISSVMLFTHAIRKEAHLVLKDAPDLVIQRMVAGRHDLIPVAYKEQIKDILGVSSVHERLWGYYYDPVNGANYTLIVPEDGHVSPGEIGIGNGISRSSSVYENDILSIRNHRGEPVIFQIREILSSESELVSADLIIVAEEDFRDLFGIDTLHATDIILSAKNRSELPTIAAKIYKLFPDTRPILKDEMLRTYDSVFNWRSGMMIVILSGSVLAFIMFAWDKATGLSAEERREIGILKSIGWETSDVLLMKFWEGSVISLSAFLTGFILAYLHVFFTSSVIFEPALKGWSILYPKFTLTPFLDIYQIATLFCLTVVPYTVATIIPSWRAATIDPDSVMR